jgi:PmbA protein
MDITAFARETMALAQRKHLDDCELVVNRSDSLVSRMVNKDVKLVLEQDIFTAAIRILKDGGIGYIPLSEPDLAALSAGIDSALTDLRPFPLDRFAVLPDKLPELDCFDPKVAALIARPKELNELSRELAGKAFATGKVETFEGTIGVSEDEKLVFTMHSSRPAILRRSGIAASAEVNARDFEFLISRRWLDPNRVAGLGAELALSLPGKDMKPEDLNVKGRPVTVILHPYILEVMLATLVGEHVFATSAQAGLSRYRPGDRVAAAGITLIDDALAPETNEAFPTDDEGVPTRRNVIIEQGTFKGYLYDRASAKVDNRQSTGNGKRRPILAEDENEAPVRCSVRSLELVPGTKPLSQMIAETENGILVKFLLGIHTANKTTGDFTNTVHAGRVIQSGKVVALPESGRWSLKGNALEILKTVQELSRDTVNTGSSVLPYLKVELTVS